MNNNSGNHRLRVFLFFCELSGLLMEIILSAAGCTNSITTIHQMKDKVSLVLSKRQEIWAMLKCSNAIETNTRIRQ